MQTFTEFTATTTRTQIRSACDDRVAYVMQNLSDVPGEVIRVSNSQTGACLELDPREKFGRDIYAPRDEIWIESALGTPTFLLVEDF